MNWVYSLWKFSRPHTIIGTSLSVFALYFIAIAAGNSSITWDNLQLMLGAWLTCSCGNIYIVGLNQLTDIAIDKINKPHLPVAAGEFSEQQGKIIVLIAGILSLCLSAYLGIWLFLTVAISLILGTAYSLPPIRLKRFPLLAAFCIFTVRGIVINIGLFLYFTKQLIGRELLTNNLWTLTLFILIFTVAIAIFKDVPDVEGDRQYNINTFTLILGQSAIFNLARWVITVCYLGMIAAGLFWLNAVNVSFFIVFHLILLAVLWWRSTAVNLAEKSSIVSFYQFIWKLFFLEYLLFPTSCFF